MAPDDDRPEPKVKELLAGAPLDRAAPPSGGAADRAQGPTVEQAVDLATQAELARWFNLPSFEQLVDEGVAVPEPEDPELVELRARRAKAVAAVDPALLEAMHQRNEVKPETLIRFATTIELRVKTEMGAFDHAMAERRHLIAEPRELEVPEALRDDMKDVAPQALLRDLHRAETFFDKTFELVDPAARQRLDIVAEVASAMATRWQLPPFDLSPFEQERRLLEQDRATRRRPWIELPMRNRTVGE